MVQQEFVTLISAFGMVNAAPQPKELAQLGIFSIGDLEGTLFFDEASDNTAMMAHIKFGYLNAASQFSVLASLLEVNLSLAKSNSPVIGALPDAENNIHLVLVDRISVDSVNDENTLRERLAHTAELAQTLRERVKESIRQNTKRASAHMLSGTRR
jgi:hypothetical protein